MTRRGSASVVVLASLCAAQEGLAESLKVVVLPLRPVAACTVEVAGDFTRRLKQAFRENGARVIEMKPGWGATDTPTPERLVEVGRAARADRVIAGTLRLEGTGFVPGEVWEIDVEQVAARTGRPYGSFKRVTAFGRSDGARLLGGFAKRLLDHDPNAPRLVMKDPAPMRAPDDAPKEAGMAYVPAGEFIMGSERGEVDEEPRHVVYTDAFFIDIYETTNAQYDKCVAAKRCKESTARRLRKMDAPDQPVAGVGFDDAVAYCAFAGQRLLTEAEWEKAARGVDERVFPWGNEWRADWVNMASGKDGFTHTAPVGSFPRNVSPYGVYDMAGNVWEWTADRYDPEYYRKSPARNPKGGDNPRAKRRVMRGGSWMYDVPFFVTTHNRSPGRPHIRKRWVGIRCGKDAPKR